MARRWCQRRCLQGTSDGCGGLGASGAHDSACGGANNGSVQGPSDTRDGASEGAHASCEEEKAGRRVASDGSRGSACGGANGGCSGQGAGGTRSGASGGARAGCDGGRVDRRVVTRGGGAYGGANGCDDTHCALTGGGGGSLKGGDGCGEVGWSDAGGG
jgi:hypothetical protein